MKAEILREYGPFPGLAHVHGVTFDGARVWFATGTSIQSFDAETGALGDAIPGPYRAGTAFDGTHLFQIVEGGEIAKIDPKTKEVLARIPAPESAAGLTWAEGALWVGLYKTRKIAKIDPTTGKVLKTLDSPRYVTGVTFADGDLWHGTWENDTADIRHIDRESGEVLEVLELPSGTGISGLEYGGHDRFYAGTGPGGRVRAVRRPKR